MKYLEYRLKNLVEVADRIRVIAMARSLGLRVVAEGVESAGQAQWPADEGCDLLQGFYFSRPLPGDELLAFLDSFRT